MKLSTLLLALGFSIFFTSCDPHAEYHRTINNLSDYDLLLVNYTNTQIDSIVIPAGDDHFSQEFNGLGIISEFRDCPNFKSDSMSIHVINPDSLRVTSDINNLVKWDYNPLDKGSNGGGACHCLFYIGNTNIE